MLKAFSVSKWWLPVLSVLILFCAHVALGANTNVLAMIFTIPTYTLCLVCLTFIPQVGWVLAQPNFKMVLVFFALTLGLVTLQLTPFLPGSAHPFWTWEGGPEVITLDRDATFRELIKLGALGAMFLVGLALSTQDKRAELLFQLMIFAGGLFALWAFIDYLSIASAAPKGYAKSFRRLEAGFGSANSAAALFGMLSILSLASIIRAAKSIASKTSNHMVFFERFIRRSPIAIIALLFTVTSLLLTASRGGISASMVAILVFTGWELLSSSGQKSGSGRVTGVFVLALSLIALVFLMSSGLFIDRLDSTVSSSGVRAQTLAAHWQAFQAAPWAGYGLGSFYQVNDTLMNAQNWWTLHDTGAAHNVYIQWFEETGIIGSILMFFTIALILRHVFQGLRTRRRMHTWLRAILCISLFLLLHGMVDYGLQVPSIAMNWALLLGVGIGLSSEREA